MPSLFDDVRIDRDEDLREVMEKAMDDSREDDRSREDMHARDGREEDKGLREIGKELDRSLDRDHGKGYTEEALGRVIATGAYKG